MQNNNLNENFIEAYSKQFAVRVSERFFASNDYITGQEILTLTPSKQVNFFIIKLLFNNWQDESRRLESPFFDYTNSEVRDAMVQFMNVLSRHIRIRRAEFQALLRDAVKDTLFLIMSPNSYMKIEINRKGIEILTDKSVRNLTKYIKIAEEAFSKAINDMIGSDPSDIGIDESIITQEILAQQISYLNEIFPLTMKDFEQGNDDESLPVVESEDLFDERYEDNQSLIEAEGKTKRKNIITNLSPDEEDEEDEDAILNSKFEDPMRGSIVESHEKTDSMLSAISLNHRYMFINELFDGDADLFAQAIGKVEDSTSFDDSVEILVQNYAREFHWDMNSDEVKELLKIIFRRFR